MMRRLPRPVRNGPPRSGAAIRLAVVLLALIVASVVSLPAHAQSFQIIHYFSGTTDGEYPLAGLTLDSAGNLYGTSSSMSNQQTCPTGCLVVYQLSPNGSGWNFTVVFAGQSASQGSTAISSMVFGPDGNLYGTTAYGGNGNGCYPGRGCGVVFKMAPANGGWNQSIVYPFSALPDGNFPRGQLAFDSAGNLYGATSGGGSNVGCLGGGCDGNGTVYKLALANGSASESILYAFGSTRVDDGVGPSGGVAIDSQGNLYGTTVAGGELNHGTVFELMPSGSGWSETTLYNFHGGNDGIFPAAGVIVDAAGNLYGSTEYDYHLGGGGTVFELSPSGTSWTHNVLYEFPSRSCGTPPCHLGAGPQSNLIMDRAGNLYGTTSVDGSYGCGAVFKLTRAGDTWNYTSLHDFTCGIDGDSPVGSLVMDSAGNLYGTTTTGGVPDLYCGDGCGVIFKITP